MYHYRLYGLTVASQIKIPDAECATLSDTNRDADVMVTLNHVPDFSTHETLVKLTDAWYYAVSNPQLFFMHCYGFDFEISNGSTIKVDTHNMTIEGTNLIAYILGSSFGVIGIQRGLIPIHGASIVTKDSVAIITGYTGSGKSAILSALTQLGYQYLADDVSMIATVGGVPFVIPSYPQRKTAITAAEEIGEDISSTIPILEDGRNKYAIRKTSEWLEKELPLSRIVEIIPSVKEDNSVFTPEIYTITGHASLKMVLRNLYRPQFVERIGTPPQRMKKLIEIASSIKTYQVIRPITGFSISETARIIKDQCF